MPSQQELFEKITTLTEAVARLAARDDRRVDEETQQRVDFGYRALGRLMGRTGGLGAASFDVDLVGAARRPRGVVLLLELPPRADWVEVRAGGRLELRRVRRVRTHRSGDPDYDAPRDNYPAFAQGDATEESSSQAQRGARLGLVRLDDIADATPIDSIVVLDRRTGPLLAFGPRLPAV
jgi:hypothetical protein